MAWGSSEAHGLPETTMATTTILTRTYTIFLLCITYVFLWIALCSDHYHTPVKGIDIGNPVINVTPAPINVISEGSKDVLLCERVPVSGVSRLKLKHYTSVFNVTLVPSVLMPKQWHNKIQVCFHRNSSLGLCQCEKDYWRSLQNGLWMSTMSAYEHKYVDVKFGDTVTGSVTVTLKEVQQRWRYILLAVGLVLLFLAPVVSEWVPFYYTSSIFVAIIAIILIILYQARKLMPIGRRNTFYLGIMSTLIGARSFVLHNLSVFLKSVLLNFGISPEIQKLVFVFSVIGISLLGAAFGYWLVRRHVISEEGEVIVGVALFVKWSMRIVAVTCIILSTNDTLFAMLAVGSCLGLYHVITKIMWHYYQARSYSGKQALWARSKQTTPKHGHAEFLTQSKKTSPLGSPWSGPMNSFRWSKSPVKRSTGSRHDVYSTFHNTPDRKKFSKEEWEEFTEESTRQSVAELTSTPEFTDWVINNADRIKLVDEQHSSDDSDGSGSDFSDENVQQSGTGQGFFSWTMLL